MASTTSTTPPNNDPPETISSAGNAAPSVAEPASSEIVADSELQAEFTDDENFDAEVFDDDMDPDNSISEKTITLSVAEGRRRSFLMIEFFLNYYFFQTVAKSKHKLPMARELVHLMQHPKNRHWHEMHLPPKLHMQPL